MSSYPMCVQQAFLKALNIDTCSSFHQNSDSKRNHAANHSHSRSKLSQFATAECTECWNSLPNLRSTYRFHLQPKRFAPLCTGSTPESTSKCPYLQIAVARRWNTCSVENNRAHEKKERLKQKKRETSSGRSISRYRGRSKRTRRRTAGQTAAVEAEAEVEGTQEPQEAM